jgi:hypothetical protein
MIPTPLGCVCVFVCVCVCVCLPPLSPPLLASLKINVQFDSLASTEFDMTYAFPLDNSNKSFNYTLLYSHQRTVYDLFLFL